MTTADTKAPTTTASGHSHITDAMARWPQDLPLAGIIAGDPRGRTRYSLLTAPESLHHLFTLEKAYDLIRPTQSTQPAHAVFGTGWLISIQYRAGHQIEPTSSKNTDQGEPTPIVTLARVNSGLVIDNRSGEQAQFGTPPQLSNSPAIEHRQFSLGEPSGLEREHLYKDAVGKVVQLIRAGDVFQVNLTHRLWAEFAGSTRALAASLFGSLKPWHGFYLETPGAQTPQTAIASASPELFLGMSSDNTVQTRPMKGTRPGSTDCSDLSLAPKDRAELAMIVDLMRNDLGKVCRFGSVRVTQDRTIEPHGGTESAPSLWQGVATVEGKLRDSLDVCDLIGACFPPGSITGAPKVRAMQIIDELEPSLGFDDALPKRGPYCGACGYIGDDGSAQLNVAIRTAIFTGESTQPGTLTSGTVHYPVGAGIVADSVAEEEWQETLDKAKPFLDLCRQFSEDELLLGK